MRSRSLPAPRLASLSVCLLAFQLARVSFSPTAAAVAGAAALPAAAGVGACEASSEQREELPEELLERERALLGERDREGAASSSAGAADSAASSRRAPLLAGVRKRRSPSDRPHAIPQRTSRNADWKVAPSHLRHGAATARESGRPAPTRSAFSAPARAPLALQPQRVPVPESLRQRARQVERNALHAPLGGRQRTDHRTWRATLASVPRSPLAACRWAFSILPPRPAPCARALAPTRLPAS